MPSIAPGLILIALLSGPAAGGATPTPHLGAPYPGAKVTELERRPGCLVRYAFETAAPLAQIADFYRGEARAAGLLLVSDTAGDAHYRMLVFGERGPGRMLAAFIHADGRGAKGRVVASELP
jgi:hypothetical protein